MLVKLRYHVVGLIKKTRNLFWSAYDNITGHIMNVLGRFTKNQSTTGQATVQMRLDTLQQEYEKQKRGKKKHPKGLQKARMTRSTNKGKKK